MEPTGDIGTVSEFVSHTAVQIEIEVAPKETAGVQYYPLLSILFRAEHFFPYMVSKGYTLTLHDDTWIGYIPSAKGEITNYTRYVSGKIIFQGFSNGIVTLQLDNVTFADKNNQSNKSCGVADESLVGWRRQESLYYQLRQQRLTVVENLE